MKVIVHYIDNDGNDHYVKMSRKSAAKIIRILHKNRIVADIV